jgi:hypothetical protein
MVVDVNANLLLYKGLLAEASYRISWSKSTFENEVEVRGLWARAAIFRETSSSIQRQPFSKHINNICNGVHVA